MGAKGPWTSFLLDFAIPPRMFMYCGNGEMSRALLRCLFCINLTNMAVGWGGGTLEHPIKEELIRKNKQTNKKQQHAVLAYSFQLWKHNMNTLVTL